MRLLSIALFLVFLAVPLQEIKVEEVRNLYKQAAENETAAEELLEVTEGAMGSGPIFVGYLGAAHMMMAKHVGNPFKKYSHFNKGKEFFTEAINADDDNVELRFLRFSVQAEAPAFLGYRDNLEEDKKMLLRDLPRVKNPQVQEMIYNYLKSSKGLSDLEKEKLNKSLF